MIMLTRHRAAMNAFHHVALRAAALLAAASLAASANTIAVTNLVHSNGWYSFDLVRADAYFQLGGDALMRSLVLHAYQVLEASPPPGWLAQLDSSTLTFVCTNLTLLDATNALRFAFHSAIMAETIYNETDVFVSYPQGIALGELYGPGAPITPALDGYVASINAGAQERFTFLGPVVPEPLLALPLWLLLCRSARLSCLR